VSDIRFLLALLFPFFFTPIPIEYARSFVAAEKLNNTDTVDKRPRSGSTFYSARNARIASAVLATAIPSVCPSVRLSVYHTPVLCQNDGT